jgi:hypothetical protein
MQSNLNSLPNIALSIFIIFYAVEFVYVCLLNPHYPQIMTATTTQTTIQTLTTLKHHYEQQLTQAEAPASAHYADLLSHTDALLVSLLVQNNGPAAPIATLNPLAQASTPKAVDQSKPKAVTVPASRISFELLPAYQGKSKLEAIGTVLEKNQGEVVYHDSIIKELYGELSPEALKVERLRMKAALRQGVKKKLWQKASAPSSYILKSSAKPNATPAKPKTERKPAPATKTNGRGRTTGKSPAVAEKSTPAAKSKTAAPKQPEIISLQSKTQGTKIILPMHSDFDGLSKLHAVLKVMNENTGKVINVDDIIERLFGQLSLADYKAEKGRMKDVMNRGVKGGLWRKAPAPLSFIVGKPETNKAKVSGRRVAAKGRQARVG